MRSGTSPQTGTTMTLFENTTSNLTIKLQMYYLGPQSVIKPNQGTDRLRS